MTSATWNDRFCRMYCAMSTRGRGLAGAATDPASTVGERSSLRMPYRAGRLVSGSGIGALAGRATKRYCGIRHWRDRDDRLATGDWG